MASTLRLDEAAEAALAKVKEKYGDAPTNAWMNRFCKEYLPLKAELFNKELELSKAHNELETLRRLLRQKIETDQALLQWYSSQQSKTGGKR